MLTETKRENMINQMIKWCPNYERVKLEVMNNNQLYATYQRLNRERKDIIEKIHTIQQREGDFLNLTPQDIFNSSTKKLKKIVDNYQTSISKNNHQNNLELSRQIYKDENDPLSNEYGHEDLQCLSYEELYIALGAEPSDYSERELALKGYILDTDTTPNNSRISKEQKVRKALKNQLINIILSLNSQIQDLRQLKRNLERLPLDTLIEVYENHRLKAPCIPNVEQIKLQLKNDEK